MEKNEDRVHVIENIKKSVENGNFNSRVELGDHVVTEEERQNVVMKFDTLRKKPINKLKRSLARKVARRVHRNI